ncbi:MAG: ABC transporter permease [Flavobacteriia bacterium]|nr:ABC transporter permease [Flavobacteriia bacterium]
MKNSWLIASREFMDRWNSRSYQWMLIIGPLVILLFTYFLLKFGDQGKRSLRVLIADPTDLFDNKITSNPTQSIKYAFYTSYLDFEEFRDGNRFKEFDAFVEINEKILNNKTVKLFYRERPSMEVKIKLKFELERRVEECMIEQFTNLGIDRYRQIKQPLNIDFLNVYDPKNQAENEKGWVGLFFGAIILFFIGLFGMTILRSTSKDKSNRVVEVLLASVRSTDLMLGKIIGIGISAFFQLLIWSFVIIIGLLIFKEYVFTDIFDPSKYEGLQYASEVKNEILANSNFARYNTFIDLIYHRINYTVMLPVFLFFFAASYFFYAAFFMAIGATAGSESDGQQFIIPIFCLLLLSFYAGFQTIYSPDSFLAQFFAYFPFTAAMVALINVSIGVTSSGIVQLILGFLFLLLNAFFFLWISARLFENGILNSGHRLTWKTVVQWLKKT